jgi:hypothetical protein
MAQSGAPPQKAAVAITMPLGRHFAREEYAGFILHLAQDG